MPSLDCARSADGRTLLEIYQISGEDLDRVRKLGALVTPALEEHVARFYEWLERQQEFHVLFTRPETIERVKRLQLDYWRQFLEADVGDAYLERRRLVGQVHAQVGLSLQSYFAAMNRMFEIFRDATDACDLSAHERADTVGALTKLLHLDTAVVVDTFTHITNETITEQSRTLVAMSTPVTAVWQDILLLPIVGVVDSRRAQDIMDAMLNKIAETQAKVIILDIGGVAVVDTAVANHLIKITKATRLMGCECTISGVSPAIARTIVELGIDVGEIRTTAMLRDAVATAFETVGISLSQAR